MLDIQMIQTIRFPLVLVCLQAMLNIVSTADAAPVPNGKAEHIVVLVWDGMRPDIIKQLRLLRPMYSRTTNYGHCGKTDDRESLTWERVDKVSALKKALRHAA